MAIVDSIKDLVGSFVTTNYTELPGNINSGLQKYLKGDEEVILTLLNYRAIYKAPKFIDSNTFFNSWFILTNDRIIVARNSSKFKRFRDIPLGEITQIFYELDNTEPRISITTPGNEDIIEFMKAGADHCQSLEIKLEDALKNAKNRNVEPDSTEYIKCNKCGSEIQSQSKYCSECGARIDAF
jgi:hypothetical protein